MSGLATAAPPYANLTLVFELAMGVGLFAGEVLARLKRFRQHAWCQSIIVLVNLVLIVLIMAPSFRVHVAPRIPSKLGKAYYAVATAHAALGTLAEVGGFVHSASGRHEPVAAAITHPQLQAVDANRVSAVVGGPFVRDGNLRSLVHSPHFPQVTKSLITQHFLSLRPTVK